MPHMKYFQGIADIETHLDDVLEHFENPKYGPMFLSTWGIHYSDIVKKQIQEEKDVLRYLLGCQLGFTRETDVEKPALALVERCFNRHLKYLEKIHKIDQWNVNKHPSKNIKREYKTCRHYLFKFTQKGWVDRLPNKIQSFENKYPDPDDIFEDLEK